MAAVIPAPTCTPTHKIIKTTSIATNTNHSVCKHTLLIVSFVVPDHTAHTAYLYIIYEQYVIVRRRFLLGLLVHYSANWQPGTV
jgi:hypothetical protein